MRIENDVDAAGAIVEIQNFFPGFAAIARAVDAAIRIGAVSVAERSNENDIGIRGMDDDGADVACVFEADVGPGLSGIGRFVNAIAERNIAADARFAGAGVDHVGIGVSNGDGADRGRWAAYQRADPRRCRRLLFSKRRRSPRRNNRCTARWERPRR